MVNKERVQLLVDALRSGDYHQGQGALEYVDPRDGQTKNCCLGVAFRVAMAHGLGMETGESTYDNLTLSFKPDEFTPDVRVPKVWFSSGANTNYLSEQVSDWYGFTSDNPRLGESDAVELNDDNNATLSEIADAFEREFLNNETER